MSELIDSPAILNVFLCYTPITMVGWRGNSRSNESHAARFGGISDTITVGFSLQSDAAAVSALVQKLQAIPSRFTGFSHDWATAP
jgi:hypothetical protein